MRAAVCVSEACQINDLDHALRFDVPSRFVSEACQINDLDHQYDDAKMQILVSEACQINDLDHLQLRLQS